MTYDLKSSHFCIKSDRVMTRNSITNSLKVNECGCLNGLSLNAVQTFSIKHIKADKLRFSGPFGIRWS